ncbi:hypothetical protein OIO90_001020 [Microbotryomycetes sp. JL221]|nr:hypothetical protein OIO90_001020 [Microbotryomycetes sp. JL221]
MRSPLPPKAERKLSKKQKKAESFRANKGKHKGAKPAPAEPLDVPQLDSINDDDEPEQPQVTDTTPNVDKSTKKRKRDDTAATTPTEVDDNATTSSPAAKKSKPDNTTKPTTDTKSRLVVFVGETPEVRLLTPKLSKYDKNKPVTKSKGCAFVEFTQPLALQAALKKHQTELGKRKINVELTAGGGGNSEQRRKKIQSKRAKLTEERDKAAKNKRKRDGEPVVDKVDGVRQWGTNGDNQNEAESGKDATPKTRVTEVVGQDGKKKKIRDRRLNKKEGGAAGGSFNKGGRNEKPKGGAASPAAKGGKKMPWMTGANAVKLG